MPAKITFMEEWVHKAHDLLLAYDFRKSLLPTAVRHANVAVRKGLNDFLALSDVRACVPCSLWRLEALFCSTRQSPTTPLAATTSQQ